MGNGLLYLVYVEMIIVLLKLEMGNDTVQSIYSENEFDCSVKIPINS